MEEFQTIIIGAGPAGLSCAALLAQSGHKVLVLEKKTLIGPKVCAGGIPYHALVHLQLPEDLLEVSFPAQEVFTPRQNTTITSKLPIISTVNRQQLGQFMAEKAMQAGAVILTDNHVKQIDSTTVETKDQIYSFQNLVGADGSNSAVRRFLHLPRTSVGVGIHYQVPGRLPKMEWHFDPKIFGSGYAWIFPHQDSSSVGAYVEQQEMPANVLKERLDRWAAKQGISLKECQPEAALINFDYRGWHFDNIFLAGDAAGLASAVTGEGMLPAVISGEAVARTIMNPKHLDQALAKLINKHKRHRNMQKTLASNKVICHLLLEMLVLGLRLKAVPFKALEMS